MKIYVAGAYTSKEMPIIIKDLEERGLIITHNWTLSVSREPITDEILATEADLDLEGVKACDILVVYMSSDTYEYRGTMTEVGMALALNKEILLYNPHHNGLFFQKMNVFYYHPLIKHYISYNYLVRDLILRTITIVAFTGPKECGKDTGSNLLNNGRIISDRDTGYLAFAKNLKEICMTVFNLKEEDVYDTVLKEKDFDRPIILSKEHLVKINQELPKYLKPEIDLDTIDHSKFEGLSMMRPRHLMQFVGTDYIRNNIDPLWNVNAFIGPRTINSLKVNGIYFITDMRFPNEYLFLKNLKLKNFMPFYIYRDRAEEMLQKSEHESERQVIEVRKLLEQDYGPKAVIYNNGSLKDFHYLLETSTGL